MNTCVQCKAKLQGAGIACIKDQLYCQVCNQAFEDCPLCHHAKTLKEGKCLECNYVRRKCDKCKKDVDSGVWRLSQLLCERCVALEQKKDAPKGQSPGKMYAIPGIPPVKPSYPDFSGCYDPLECHKRGYCNCCS